MAESIDTGEKKRRPTRNTKRHPSVNLEEKLKDKPIWVKCNQTGEVHKPRISQLTIEGGGYLTAQDLLPGKELLMEVGGKAYRVTTMKRTESELDDRIKKPKKKTSGAGKSKSTSSGKQQTRLPIRPPLNDIDSADDDLYRVPYTGLDVVDGKIVPVSNEDASDYSVSTTTSSPESDSDPPSPVYNLGLSTGSPGKGILEPSGIPVEGSIDQFQCDVRKWMRGQERRSRRMTDLIEIITERQNGEISVGRSSLDLLNDIKKSIDDGAVAGKGEKEDPYWVVNGVNLQSVQAKDAYAFGRVVLDTMFTDEEMAKSVIKESRRSERPALSPKRVLKMFEYIDSRFEEYSHKEMMITLGQKLRDTGRGPKSRHVPKKRKGNDGEELVIPENQGEDEQ